MGSAGAGERRDPFDIAIPKTAGIVKRVLNSPPTMRAAPSSQHA